MNPGLDVSRRWVRAGRGSLGLLLLPGPGWVRRGQEGTGGDRGGDGTGQGTGWG